MPVTAAGNRRGARALRRERLHDDGYKAWQHARGGAKRNRCRIRLGYRLLRHAGEENSEVNTVMTKHRNHTMPGYITVTDSEQLAEEIEGDQKIPGHVTLMDSERRIGDNV